MMGPGWRQPSTPTRGPHANELKAKCTEVVHDFLSRNVDLLTELGQVIASELVLDRAQIEPFLRRAIGTEALALGDQGSNLRRG